MAKDAEASSGYPIHFGVDDPDLQSRWKALLRLPLSIPALIFSSLLLGGAALAIWAAILVGGKIPTWALRVSDGGESVAASRRHPTCCC